jgi:NADP-dependent 3-hydroxy acid dehydrogenase YdfG
MPHVIGTASRTMCSAAGAMPVLSRAETDIGDKVVVITGASNGLGEGAARLLAQARGELVLTPLQACWCLR